MAQTLEKILAIVRDAGALDDNMGAEDWTHSDVTIDLATQAIRQAVDEILGEDTKHSEVCNITLVPNQKSVPCDCGANATNYLRKEQRARAMKFIEGSK